MELQRFDKERLEDGHAYSSWWYISDGEVIQQGSGTKYFDGYYVRGNFHDEF